MCEGEKVEEYSETVCVVREGKNEWLWECFKTC